ncbi:MAG: glycosyltransferase [Nanopusillaceae archaeon]
MVVSIIVPVLNEKENIEELVDRIDKTLKDVEYEIIFVDDGSDDGTIDIINNLINKNKKIKLLERGSKKGLASAFVDGLKLASGDYIVLMDADLQHPPELLKKMYDKIREGYDLIIASRYVEGGKTEGWSFKRKLMSRIAILLSHILLPETLKIKDVTSGYFMIRKELLNDFEVSDPFSYKVLLDILVKIRPKKILEIPYTFKERKYGESKLKGKVMISYIVQIIKLFDFWQFIKFNIVGISGIFVNIGSLYILYQFLPFYISSLLSIIASIIWNFMLNDFLVFKEKRKPFVQRFLLFIIGRGIISQPFQYFSALFFFYVLNLNYILSQLLAIFFAAMINWVYTKGVVYN